MRIMKKGKAETKQKRKRGSNNLSPKQTHSCYATLVKLPHKTFSLQKNIYFGILAASYNFK